MKREYVELLGGAIIFVILFAAIGFIAQGGFGSIGSDDDTGETTGSDEYRKAFTYRFDNLLKAHAGFFDPTTVQKEFTLELNLAQTSDFYADLKNGYEIYKFTAERLEFEYKTHHSTVWPLYTGSAKHYYEIYINEKKVAGSLTTEAVKTNGKFIKKTVDIALVVNNYKTIVKIILKTTKAGCYEADTYIQNVIIKGYAYFRKADNESASWFSQMDDYNRYIERVRWQSSFVPVWLNDYLIILQAVSGTLGVIVYIYIIKKFRREESARAKR